MGRYITTIGLKPEAMTAYKEIKQSVGSFSDYISNLLIAQHEGEDTTLLRLDALLRYRERLEGKLDRLTNQLRDLYNNNGLVRKELKKAKFDMLEEICLEGV